MKPDFLIKPFQVYSSKELRPIDGDVYSVIYWFEHLKDGKCIASNATIGKVLAIHPKTVGFAINRLEKAGFIKCEYQDTHRTSITSLVAFKVQSNDSTPLSNGRRGSIKRLRGVQSNGGHISNSRKSNKERVINTTSVVLDKSDHRNMEVQEIIDALNDSLEGIPMDGTQKENRRYAYLLLKKIKKACHSQGHDESKAVPLIKGIIHAAFQGWHKKNSTSLKYIYYNMGKIIQESKQKTLNVLTI